jgi:hypothetical protein
MARRLSPNLRGRFTTERRHMMAAISAIMKIPMPLKRRTVAHGTRTSVRSTHSSTQVGSHHTAYGAAVGLFHHPRVDVRLFQDPAAHPDVAVRTGDPSGTLAPSSLPVDLFARKMSCFNPAGYSRLIRHWRLRGVLRIPKLARSLRNTVARNHDPTQMWSNDRRRVSSGTRY